jgi:hypothetical protein
VGNESAGSCRARGGGRGLRDQQGPRDRWKRARLHRSYHEEYDPATDKWRARAPGPRSLDHIGTTVLNEKIYAFGGFVGGAVHKDGQNTAFEYDPMRDTWRTLAPMKGGGRGSVSTVALDGKIHVLGGRFGASSDRTNLHEVYDPKTNAWTPGPPLPTPRSGLAYTTYRGLFLVLGGEMPGQGTNAENEAYDAKTGSWLKLAPMPAGRHAAGAARDGNRVYVAAGSLTPGGAGATNQLIVFTLP